MPFPIIDDVVPYEAGRNCPVNRAVRVIGGKWKMQIVYHLLEKTLRFGELHKAIPGVTHHMLTAQLRELEADMVIQRVVHAQVPPRVDYSLTELGRALLPVGEALTTWGLKLPEGVGAVTE